MKKITAIFIFILASSFQQNKTDVEMILQQCLDLPKLQPYYNIDKFPEERKPVIIMKSNFFKENPKVSKFGVPVVFLSQQEIWNKNTNAYIEFFRFNLMKDSAYIKFQYKIEGIQLELQMKKENGEWVVKKEKII